MSDVWIAALRRGIPHHAVNGAQTACGRHIGGVQLYVSDATLRDFGWVLSEERSVADFASKPCRRCFPAHDTEAR